MQAPGTDPHPVRIAVRLGEQPPKARPREGSVQAALTAAGCLQTAFGRRGLDVDVHELASDRAVVSVARGVLVYTDGPHFWWKTWDTPQRRKPRVTLCRTVERVVETLLQHPAVIKRRQTTETSYLPV